MAGPIVRDWWQALPPVEPEVVEDWWVSIRRVDPGEARAPLGIVREPSA